MLNAPLKKGQIIDLLNLPDHVIFTKDSIQITNVDVPLYLPDGSVGGKARVVEGDDSETTVLVEMETSNPIVAALFKGDIIGISLVHREIPNALIEEVKIDMD